MLPKIEHISFPAVRRFGVDIVPHIKLVRIDGASRASLALLGENTNRIRTLKKAGIFDLPEEISYPGDAMRNGGISPEVWFSKENTDKVFDDGVAALRIFSLIAATNAGNSPLHNYEMSFDSKTQHAHVASKEILMGAPMPPEGYFCVTSRAHGVNIEYVRFSSVGRPDNDSIMTAVGGRPLVHEGGQVDLAKILKASITDPRHVLRMPEVDLETGEGRYMPLGIRTIQNYLRADRAEEIMLRIRSGEPILIKLGTERGYDPGITPSRIAAAMELFGYGPDDWHLDKDELHMQYKLNDYRHTFWAKSGDSVFIGIIGNSLEQNDGRFNDVLYKRILKQTGLTMFQLQSFIVGQLKAESAVLLGNGKDTRIYLSEKPHDPIHHRVKVCDSDARPEITAGLVAIAI